MTDAMWTKTQAKRLHVQGYRGVSNRHHIVSRVDQDIVEFVMQDRKAFKLGKGPKNWSNFDFLLKLPKDEREDWFRRCVSKDTLTVTPEIYKAMKNL